MTSLSAKFGDVLGVSEPSARFLFALFSAYPFAFLYRITLAEGSSTLKNIYFTMSGVWIMYYVYGFTVWHSMVDIFSVYIVLRLCGGTLLSVYLTWFITMGHLVCGYISVVYLKQVHPISWTIPHCVLVLKLIGLSFNIYDGRKDQDKLGKDLRELAVDRIPSLLEVLGFSFFYGSELAGPQIPFSLHLKFTEGRLFEWRKVPNSIPAGIQRLMAGLFFALVYSVLNQYFPITMLATDQFAEKPFLFKLVIVTICGKVALWRYITVWLIAEGSCILTGISYGEEKGKINWHTLANIHIIKFETSITFQGVVDSFNLNTNKWVAWYVYKRLKFLGNKLTSWGLTMLFVSIWHGVWPGYYINFSLEMIIILAERTFISFMRRLLGCSLSDMRLVIRIPLTIFAYLFRNCFLMYPIAIFMLLTWSDCYKFMSSVYFYCHVLMIGWLLLYHSLLSSLFRKKQIKAE